MEQSINSQSMMARKSVTAARTSQVLGGMEALIAFSEKCDQTFHF